MSVELKDVQFSMDLVSEIDQEDFPLTYEMIHKNRYDETVRVRKLFRYTRSKPSAVVIYRDKYNDDNAMTRRRIFCFEVALGEHGRGLGHRLMEEIKWDADEITLCYLVEAKFFYIKEGFIESGENELKWERSYDEAEEE